MLVSNGFDLEKDLVAALQEGSAAALNVGDRWCRFVSEVTVRERVADLILLHAAQAPDVRPHRLSYFEAAIVAFLLRHGASTLDAIADDMFADSPSVEARVSKLARLGFVDVVGRYLHPASKRLTDSLHVVAIEAKLTRWRDAVEQATCYRSFANQSYIAMPASAFERSGAIWSRCLAAGVGALSVTPSGEVVAVIDAPIVQPQSPEWVRLVSSFAGVV